MLSSTRAEAVASDELRPWQAKGLAKNRQIGEALSCHRKSFPASAGMQTRHLGGFCFLGFWWRNLGAINRRRACHKMLRLTTHEQISGHNG